MRALRLGICIAAVGALCGAAHAWQRYCASLPKVQRRTLTKSDQEQALQCVRRLLPKERDGSLKGTPATDLGNCLKLAERTITHPDKIVYVLSYEGELAENIEGAGGLIITVSRESGVVCQTEHITAEW